MTPVKDTLAILTSAAEVVDTSSSPRPATAKPESGGLRSDAVSLEVPVNVHGSRVVEIVRETTSHTEPFEERTATMIVFPQGAVLRMTTSVNAGQMVVVTNLKSGQDAICRVVKVRSYAPNQSYVEVEFTHRQVGYWGVQFSSDPFEVKKPAAQIPAPFVAPVRSDSGVKEKPVTEMPRIQTPPVAENGHELGLQIAKSISSFAPIGSQEDVHPSAMEPVASTLAGTPSFGNLLELNRRSDVTTVQAKPIENTATVGNSLLHSMPVSGGDAFPAPGGISQTATQSRRNESAGFEAPALGRLMSASILAGDTATETATGRPTPAFEHDRASENSENFKSGNKNLILIAASILAAVAAAGGYLFFARQPVSNAPLVVGAPSAPVISSSVTALVMPSASLKGSGVAGATLGQVNALSNSSAVVDAKPQHEVVSRSTAPARHNESEPSSDEPAESHTPSQVPSLFGALNAHPMAPHGSGAQVLAAPDVDVPVAASQTANALPAITPQATLEAPVHTSVQPRLVSSPSPDYPALAQQMGVEGSVIISATVQSNGSLGNMKVISGSPLLRQAALNALQHWKYVPAQVDGQPAATPITLTVHFNKR